MTAGGHSGLISYNQDHIFQFHSLATVIQALGSGILFKADRESVLNQLYCEFYTLASVTHLSKIFT